MEEINLTDLFKYFLSKILIIILITIFAGLIGSMYSVFIQTPMYKSKTTLLLANVSSIESNTSASSVMNADITLNQKLVSTYREIITSKRVLNQVINKLNLEYKYDRLKSMITVDSISNTEVISVTVINANPEEAALIANEVANTFCDEIVNIYQIQNVNIIDKAEIAENPYNINIVKQTIIYLLIGFIIGLAIIFVIYYFDTTIKSKEEIEEKVGLPVLGIIPLKKEVRKWIVN